MSGRHVKDRGSFSIYLDCPERHDLQLTSSTKCSFIFTTEGSLVDKTDLLPLYLSGTYCHKTGTRPPSCQVPLQLTIYVTRFPYETFLSFLFHISKPFNFAHRSSEEIIKIFPWKFFHVNQRLRRDALPVFS